jgi:hypothetical protein
MRIRDPGLKKFESGIRDGKNLDPGKTSRILNTDVPVLPYIVQCINFSTDDSYLSNFFLEMNCYFCKCFGSDLALLKF